MKALIKYLALLNIVICFGQIDNVERRANINMTSEFANPGILISEIVKGSPEDKSGLANNDLIISVNGKTIQNSKEFNKVRRSLRGNTKTKLILKRNGKIIKKEVEFDALPLETHSGLDIEYGSFVTDYGYAVRTLTTKPAKNTAKTLPAIYFVQWLSCSPVESRGNSNGFSNLIWNLSKAGYMLYRTEKAGTGDSNGPDCSELDFTTEYNIHKQSIKSFLNRDDIDKDHVYIMGGSMGSNIAAMLANDFPEFKALIFSGGYHKPWQERLFDFERRTMEYKGLPEEEIYNRTKLFSEFYNDYFYNEMTPGEIIKAKPKMATIWTGSTDLQYGRPVEFYVQANNVNMAKVWKDVKQPILALYGEYDWIMDFEDNLKIIKQASNSKSKLVLLNNTDHSLYLYDENLKKNEAFNNQSSKPNIKVADKIVKWLKKIKNK